MTDNANPVNAVGERAAAQVEVELKFRVADPSEFYGRLEDAGAERRGPVEVHRDEYWAHPNRDFAETREAFRIRSLNGQHLVTYKGPPQTGPAKIRREIELPFATGTPLSEIQELLSLLGFKSVATVEKVRRQFHFPCEQRQVLVTIDHVKELGFFTEIEVVCESFEVDQSVEIIMQIAEELRLESPIRQSYLTLLLESRRTDGGKP
ncbi:MAG: class IV adenylate cyclase [Pirellulaceae bacterium]|nr:class IV adenylate cyclase [Pirellulaceae bacterium]